MASKVSEFNELFEEIQEQMKYCGHFADLIVEKYKTLNPNDYHKIARQVETKKIKGNLVNNWTVFADRKLSLWNFSNKINIKQATVKNNSYDRNNNTHNTNFNWFSYYKSNGLWLATNNTDNSNTVIPFGGKIKEPYSDINKHIEESKLTLVNFSDMSNRLDQANEIFGTRVTPAEIYKQTYGK